jgi:hypothetical protein
LIGIDPRVGRKPEAHLLALKQTIHARNMLYFPNKFLEDSLSLAATNLYDFVSKKNFDGDDKLLIALGGRLLGKEGILANKKEDEIRKSLERVAKKDQATTELC